MIILFLFTIKYIIKHASEEKRDAELDYTASFLWDINHKYCIIQCFFPGPHPTSNSKPFR